MLQASRKSDNSLVGTGSSFQCLDVLVLSGDVPVRIISLSEAGVAGFMTVTELSVPARGGSK